MVLTTSNLPFLSTHCPIPKSVYQKHPPITRAISTLYNNPLDNLPLYQNNYNMIADHNTHETKAQIPYPEIVTEIIQPEDISLATKLRLGSVDQRNNRWRPPTVIRPRGEREDTSDPYDATIWWEIRDKHEQSLGLARAYFFSAWDSDSPVKLIVTIRRMGTKITIIKRVKNFKTAKEEALDIAIDNCAYKETINKEETLSNISDYLVSTGKITEAMTLFDRTRKKERPRHLFDIDNPDDTWIAMIQGSHTPATPSA